MKKYYTKSMLHGTSEDFVCVCVLFEWIIYCETKYEIYREREKRNSCQSMFQFQVAKTKITLLFDDELNT